MNKVSKRIVTSVVTCVLLPALAIGQTNQQWRDSLAILNRMIECQPSSTDLRLKKAAVNLQLSQWEYAVEEYCRVLKIDKENLAALYFRAYAYMHLRQYVMAKSDYEFFLKLAPRHLDARLGLAVVNEKLGRMTEAMDQYNQLVEIYPDSAICFAARAAFETTIKQYDVALYDWDEAIKRQPLNADYVATKVELLITTGQTATAYNELQAAFKRGIPRYALKQWLDRLAR